MPKLTKDNYNSVFKDKIYQGSDFNYHPYLLKTKEPTTKFIDY